MKLYLLPLLGVAALALSSCAGDNHVTDQSRGRSSRAARTDPNPADNLGRPQDPGSAFTRARVYQITRLETADAPRGEWRALGETIRRQGDTIEFTELGSGKFVSFTAPHQITPTGSRGDQRALDISPSGPGEERGFDRDPGSASM